MNPVQGVHKSKINLVLDLVLVNKREMFINKKQYKSFIKGLDLGRVRGVVIVHALDELTLHLLHLRHELLYHSEHL